MRRTLRRKIRTTIIFFLILTRLIAVGCLLSLLGYFGRYYFLFEQIDSFRVQAFVVCCVGLVLAAFTRQRAVGFVMLVVALLHAVQFHSLYLPKKPVVAQETLRVMSANLLASNTDSREFINQINEIKPDVIVFQEYTSHWHQSLSSSLVEYLHRQVEIINSPFGIAIYSKQPFINAEVTYFTKAVYPAIDVTVNVRPEPVRVLAVHPVPPMNAATFNNRNQYLEALASEVRLAVGPVIVAGDFNAVPWSWQLKQLMDHAGLSSAREGFGLKPTWPGGFVPLWIPIDHILHNDRFSVVEFNTEDSAGSDHKPVWAELSFQ